MSSKSYPEESKIDAAKQTIGRGHPVAEVQPQSAYRSTACTNK